MPKRIDLTGKRYGRLTVKSFSHINAHGKACWNCVCSCGIACKALTSQLNQGTKRSCGCLRNEYYNPPVTIDGVTKQFYQWCDQNNIPPKVAYQRIRVLGWKPEQAVTTQMNSKYRMITHDGKTMSMLQWSKYLGIKYVTLKWRLKR